jgi:uncharacterized protein (TIGR02147 family)
LRTQRATGSLLLHRGGGSHKSRSIEPGLRKNYRVLGILISQILGGQKRISEEQAARLCDYMGLNPLETDYFLKLVHIDRAGTESLKIIYRRHLSQIRTSANETRNWVPEAKELSEQDRALYYSSWQFAVVRLLTSIDGLQSVEKISDALKLTPSRVRNILNFLQSRGLCTMDKSGRYERTEKNTHVEAQSPLAIRHHQNWRAKVNELVEHMTTSDLAFTCPISISSKGRVKVRTILLNAISEIAELVKASPAEEVVFLGIDWISVFSEEPRQ